MMNRLTDSEISDRLRSLEGWEVRDSRLVKSFKFKDFMSAVHFVDEIAPLAEAEGHHPDLQVGWGKVVVELTSHDAGGLTEKDFEVASRLPR
ncbi:MAG: 4a-hydroxytetrahydrobiopterin dehydratase [Chloroflexi bacterium]|nr:MAG: 4a-hydroxytetrahydrobiopterin dehydratase [Chloroflexota bacterium]TMG23535.1 MAG: 4a-hydroxytetrahydrobiopterin dehydratase [Chloroflexota bacterium]HXG95666.1 4a-hydroxytetrahydrobiopterin dehydratase [Gemmatimonadales bacterium]